jgi:ferredoxin-NADP reductase
MPRGLETTPLRVQAIRYEAESIVSLELRHPGGQPLPAFAAGAHVDLKLPNGLVRSYSICSDQGDDSRYVIAVSRDAASRGGSRWIHDTLRVGGLVETTAPANNFPLDENAERTVFIAGGIGITPIVSMIRRLEALGRDWTLLFAVRTRAHAAFLPELTALAGARPERLRVHADDEHDGAVLDVARIVKDAGADTGTHFYCCGPLPMLAAFRDSTGELPVPQVHLEYFSTDQVADKAGGFEIELAQSGLTLTVEEGKTILETIQDAGIDVPFSCTEGICGTCETRVLSGTPDHRDLVLTDQEKEAGDIMMICCSGSKTPRLVLER